MEEFFCGFSDFFTQSGQQSQREGQNFPQYGNQIRRGVPALEHPAAGQPEIGRRPRQHPQNEVAPHLSPAGGGGVYKEGRRHHQPEQQVQRPGQQGEGEAHPQDAEQVVHQPHPHPQGQGPQEEAGLVRQGGAHSAEQPGQQPAGAVPAPVFVGEGVHVPLHLQIAPVQAQLFDVQVLSPDHQGAPGG